MVMIPNPEYDRPGYCARCHECIAEFNGKDIVSLLGCATTVDFILDDNSSMKVSVCEDCKNKMTIEDIPSIMQSIYKGWIWEIENILKWDTERAESYKEKYSQRYIVSRKDVLWSKELVAETLGEEKLRGLNC